MKKSNIVTGLLVGSFEMRLKVVYQPVFSIFNINFSHAVSIDFHTIFFYNMCQFRSICQIKIKIQILLKNILKLLSVEFHVAMHFWH